MDTVDAYNETKLERSVLLDIYKRMLVSMSQTCWVDMTMK